MTFNLPWGAFQTEMGLIALALGCLVLDLFLPDDEKRGRKLASIAMIGVAMLLGHLCFQWGNFGEGLGGTLVQDGVAFYFKGLFLLAGFLALFMAREYQDHLKRGHGEFILLILFSLIGMLFLASANDFLLFFVSLETLTVSLYIMTAYLRDNEASIEAGVKYLILGALSTAVFLYGLSFVYGVTGGTSYAAVAAALGAGPVPPAFLFGMVLIIASLGFKIAAVPFHLWAPDIYEGSPTPVTAFLSIGSKTAGFAALVRLLLTAFHPAEAQALALLAALSALTILYGNLGAIPQTNVKRLLGYSSIGHSGYMLIGLAAFRSHGGEALLFYLLSYLFSTGGAFLVLVALSRQMKTDSISELAGLSKRSPLLAAAMMLSLLSLAGVPPLAGFFAKFYLLWAGVKAGLLWLVVIGVLNVITSLYYYLKIVKVMYVDRPADERPLAVSVDQKVIQYLAIAGILALGIFQGPFVRLAEMAFKG
ncbi:MAG TPA: NADH-quinone oxidoreductase subunit N [Candidatus Eisenbacteria bacterium]|nr:NADH-quinone oxidoreductase subunit N [Candidatus Eisenbacteria bacterium]